MLATGGLLVCVALLTLAAVAPVFRRDDPPRWTTRGWIGELVTLAIVCTLAIGLGYLGAGAISAYQQGTSLVDLALLVGVLALAAVAWRKLNMRARPQAMAAVAGTPAVVSGSSEAPGADRPATAGVPQTATEPPPPRPRHRAA